MRVVADNAQIAGFLGDQPDDAVLGEVSVLILVDKDISEKLPVVTQNVGIVCQQYIGVVQQVVKVHGSGNAATIHICLVDLTGIRPFSSAVGVHELPVSEIVSGRDECVLGP